MGQVSIYAITMLVATLSVGKSSYADCLHIAIATIHNVNILVSWNFKHIVNVVKIIGDYSVNLAEGYKQLDIRSPRELLTYEG